MLKKMTFSFLSSQLKSNQMIKTHEDTYRFYSHALWHTGSVIKQFGPRAVCGANTKRL